MSAAEAWPTEAMATKAVDAFARKAWEINGDPRFTWDELPVATRTEIKSSLLPVVWAALEGLPDPRHAAWELGREAGAGDALYEEIGHGPNPDYPSANPFPSGL